MDNENFLKLNIKIFALIVGLVFAAGLIAWRAGVFGGSAPSGSDNISTGKDKIKITASFYPHADFAKNIGGDLVDVTNVTPAGAEPHDYEPTPRDIARVYDSRLFIINGNGVDGWGEKIAGELKNRGVTVVNMSDILLPIKNNDPQENRPYDPHYWLDPLNAQKEADVIADALIKIDSAHEKEYNKNRDAFKFRLSELDKQYSSGLAVCERKEIVTAHNAFNYLANRYNLSTLYILGFSPDAEPSSQVIAEISTQAKQRGVKYIFFETLVDPGLAQTIAGEIGAQTLVLNPIEGLTNEDISQGKDYISIMKENLSNLRIALQCK